MNFSIPIRLPSLANCRMHWRKMAAVKRSQRRATFIAIKKATENLKLPKLPVIVTITRIGPRKLDDDNLAAACKYVRDQIAQHFSTDDGSSLYTWKYEQQIGSYRVDVEIISRQ